MDKRPTSVGWQAPLSARGARPVRVPFNRPFLTGREGEYIAEAAALHHLSGDGEFTRRCHQWLERTVGCRQALLTHSGTAALEMAALLADVGPGDEVVMPSFTFVSTANAFVLRGATPVFIDIRPDTFNLDEALVAAAITQKTKAIVAVHYAGVGCEMDAIVRVAHDRGLLVIEDAAQGLLSRYRGRPLGSIGHMAAISFHETKNVISGEGGALLINDERFVERAEIVWEKGTDRRRFWRREVDRYTWQDVGSSYLPGEIVAAFLWAQMEEAGALTARRQAIWNNYDSALASLDGVRGFRRPIVPAHCGHNAHMFYVLLESRDARREFIARLSDAGIRALFHYVPLHSSPAGLRFARAFGTLPVTDSVSARLARLPLWLGMEDELAFVVDGVQAAVRGLA